VYEFKDELNGRNSDINISTPINERIALWDYEPIIKSGSSIPDNYQEYIMAKNPKIIEISEKLDVKNEWLYGFVYKNGKGLEITYAADTKLPDYWQNPDYTLASGKGDCEDMALLAASILNAKKITAVVVLGTVKLENGVEGGHGWVEYYVDGDYYVNSNLMSFKREIEEENKISLYHSPEIKLISVNNSSNAYTISRTKYMPKYIFNSKIKMMPYTKDWIILT